MKAKRWKKIREKYDASTKDADELAEAALEELKSLGDKGDADAPIVAVAYAILAVSRRIEAASDLFADGFGSDVGHEADDDD